MIYLDNNATTMVAPEIKKQLYEACDIWGNASSMHESGRLANKAITEARNSVASLIGANSDEIMFTSGATEANNTVLNIPEGGRILVSKVEHPSIIETCKFLLSKGREVEFIDVDSSGIIRLDEYEKQLKKGGVSLCSVMAANNESGAIQPFKEACALAHKYGSLFHTDATQAIGKVDIDVHKDNIDYLSLSGHKFYAPKGCGALYINSSSPFNTFMHGGHQEQGKRAGTYNTTAIYGLGLAADLVMKEGVEERERLWSLREYLREGIEKTIDDISINSPQDMKQCLPGTLNVSFPGAEGESILLLLDNKGICVSTGSACATGSLEPSYVLLAQGIPVESAHGSIRFSLGRYNTKEEIDYVIEVLPSIISRLRAWSTRKK
ncbi:MAG: aminotransferase class V-fold PLP-dependent enzyme [Sphaerochaetaceae bacterium]|nr:aminotransferase class V-fold PLP-dependent enzyme [Sphaerochaetaceae bacterium]